MYKETRVCVDLPKSMKYNIKDFGRKKQLHQQKDEERNAGYREKKSDP